MNTYYNLTGTLNGEKEIIFGSFIRAECKYELEAERESLKADGYKKLTIEAVETNDKPSAEVYEDELVSAEVYEMLSGEDSEEAIEEGILIKSDKPNYFILTDDSFLTLTAKQAAQEIKAHGLEFSEFEAHAGKRSYYSEICLRNWLGY